MSVTVALINLDAARLRREHMGRQLRAAGVVWRRFGVDLRQVDEASMERALADHAGALRFDRRVLSNPEIGCWLSHAAAWRWRFGDRAAQAAAVLEDDVTLAPRFAATVAVLAERAPHDVAFLGTSSRNLSARRRVHLDGVHLHRPVGAIYNTWGYVIRRRYAEQLLSGAAGTIRWPIDHVLGGRIASLRPDVGVVRPAVLQEDPVLGACSQIRDGTRRLDRSRLVEGARRRLLGSRAGDLLGAICRWL